ncbi:hypothetical protein KCTCHS21_17360 [Cohnella abietis]|uniref:Uncharacterized protein n=1 Tax=Cohnella abietis TaxID=2507935 RepID=A0A3T1D2J5_9BACL|nr:hypothetical protein KCTCHS21_17360 [Cohnella abietis]
MVVATFYFGRCGHIVCSVSDGSGAVMSWLGWVVVAVGIGIMVFTAVMFIALAKTFKQSDKRAELFRDKQ